jgi:micrococcal nuclease
MSKERKMKKLVLMMIVLIGSMETHALGLFSAKVIAVVDGNTIRVLTMEKDTLNIVLYGIDSPELGQGHGEKAKKFLEKLLLDKEVQVDVKGKDRLGTRLGIVLIPGETDPRHELLREGLAWTSEINPDAEFEEMKNKARENGKGLWKEQNPTPPWTFRRQQTMGQVKSS